MNPTKIIQTLLLSLSIIIGAASCSAPKPDIKPIKSEPAKSSAVVGKYKGNFELIAVNMSQDKREMTIEIKEQENKKANLVFGDFKAGMGGEIGSGIHIPDMEVFKQEDNTYKLILSKRVQSTFLLGGVKKKFLIEGIALINGDNIIVEATYKPGRAPLDFKLKFNGTKIK